jgi:CRISPR-associated endonuclease/helicase Cas3
MNIDSSLQFWAKTIEDGQPGISVRDHCLNVGAVCRMMLVGGVPSGVPSTFVVWLAASHDIGKVSPGFQRKCPAWLSKHGLLEESRKGVWHTAEPDHSKVSQYTMQFLLREKFGLNANEAALWAAVAGMHHGAPHYRGQWNEAAGQLDSWDHHRRALAMELEGLFASPSAPPSSKGFYESLFWTAGLISVADWIGSAEQWFSPKPSELGVTVVEAETNATKALGDIGLNSGNFTPGLDFKQLFDFDPNDLQKQALTFITEPGVYVIEAPMGMGKTEAALAVAYQLISSGSARGLYFALPTQATSNRIHQRVADFLQRIQARAPRLIHGGSWLVDANLKFPDINAGQPDDQRWASRDWFASSKRALLAPFGVGTVDQALMAVIAVKHFFVRYYALAGKVVVLDEVHSYDVFTGTHIEALVEALARLGCTVIILSATLTRERREALLRKALPARPLTLPGQRPVQDSPPFAPDPLGRPEAFPLITGVVAGKHLLPRPTERPLPKPAVNIRFRDEPDILREAVTAARAGACVLWICNTVDRAQATYRALSSERCEGDPPVGLLHSRFPFFRREELEQEWMCALGKDRQHRPPGCILISTQIVEQSVDLDADLLITELAPTDMLFQRMGRLWRHWREEDKPRPLSQPEVWIIKEPIPFAELCSANETDIQKALGKKARVYAPYVLLRTLEQWHGNGNVHLPDDIRPWLEATYLDRNEDSRPAWKAMKAMMLQRKQEQKNQAITAQNVWNLPALKDEEGIGTRLDECPTLPLILAVRADNTTLTLLDGTVIKVQSHYFAYATAKALHRNIVKAPTWLFEHKDSCLKHLPQGVIAMIRLHIKGPIELGLLDGTDISADSIDAKIQLDFHQHTGLSKKTGRPSPTNDWNAYDDESYD